MAALTDLSDIINRVTGGNNGTPEHLFFYKDNRIAGAAVPAFLAGRLHSMWQNNGYPSGGVIPGAAAAPDNTTFGGLRQTNPGSGRTKWFLGAALCAGAAGSLIIYDRLLHCGGLSGIVTTLQNVGGTITRNVSGLGNQIWLEIYVPIGTTAATLTVSYTNELGVSGRTSQPVVFGGTGAREATLMIPVPLAAGDQGVRSVESVTVSVTTGTAGNFGVNIVRPIVVPLVSVDVGIGSIRDFISGLPTVPSVLHGACIALAWVPMGTVAPRILGSLHFIEK